MKGIHHPYLLPTIYIHLFDLIARNDNENDDSCMLDQKKIMNDLPPLPKNAPNIRGSDRCNKA